MPSGSSGTLLLLWVSQSHEGREGQEDGQRLPELISHGWVSYCSSMSQPSEVRGWAAVVLGPTYHSGTQLLAGDGCLLQCMVTTGRGRDGAPIREVFFNKSGLARAGVTMSHIPLAPSGGRGPGSGTFLDTQEEKDMVQRTNHIIPGV